MDFEKKIDKCNINIIMFRMMSAIGMLGTPSEMYRYGSQFGGILFSFPLMMYSVIYWYFPVFYKLEVSTSYEVKLVKEFGFNH